jgi:anthranilate synthase/aminodeoxychorismate synthase-like glutamine amidotransferase
MLLLIDNYDSFTYNLYQYLGELGATVEVVRNDTVTVEDIDAMAPERIVISPGPGNPDDAGISKDVIRRFAGKVPLLGVCLGHQCIGAAYGGEIVRAGRPMHGKISRIHHGGAGIFSGVPSPFYATRYHSLVIAPASVPTDLEVLATSEDGEVMAVRHVRDPVYGVQFHPESVLTEHGYRLVDHFLHGVPATPRALPAAADGVLVPAMRERNTLASNPPPVDLVR